MSSLSSIEKPFITVTVPPLEGRYQTSINHVLRTSGYSQALRKRLRTSGQFLIDGHTGQWNTPLHGHEYVECILPSEQSFEPYNFHLDIAYEDESLIVINKPAGLLMHPTSKERYETVANALVYYYQKTKQTAAFHPVHRLDKNTSGLVLIAKNPYVQYAFSKEHLPLQKSYTALCEGFFPTQYCTVHFPIQRHPESIIARQCSLQGKVAHTDIHRLAGNHLASLLSIYLFTGRTHQIRVHCATLGHPLIGDTLYGGPVQKDYFSSDAEVRQALHASQLSFIHPITKEYITRSSPLPSDLYLLSKKMNLN